MKFPLFVFTVAYTLLGGLPQVAVSVTEFPVVVIVGEAGLPLYCQLLFVPKFQVYPVIPATALRLFAVKVIFDVDPQAIEEVDELKLKGDVSVI